jgi:hypothetical protein
MGQPQLGHLQSHSSLCQQGPKLSADPLTTSSLAVANISVKHFLTPPNYQ